MNTPNDHRAKLMKAMSFPPASRPELLISIRSIGEWDQLVDDQFGMKSRDRGPNADQNTGPIVDIIDLKEPREGPLASPDQNLLSEVADQCSQWSDQPNDLPVKPRLSVALGESEDAVSNARQLPTNVDYAKMGIRGICSNKTLIEKWEAVGSHLSPTTQLVAVAYADHEAANCLPAGEVLAIAIECGFQQILVDTFAKDGRSSVQIIPVDQLTHFAATVRNQIWWALAGSISRKSLNTIRTLKLHPDCLGVRGEVCEGHRGTNLSIKRCHQWRDAVVERMQ